MADPRNHRRTIRGGVVSDKMAVICFYKGVVDIHQTTADLC